MKSSLRYFILVFAISLLCSTPGLAAPDDDSTQQLPPFKLYQNVKHQFQISYPSTWNMLESQMGTIVAFLAPPDADDDQFRENINVVKEDVSRFTEMTIDQYAELSKISLTRIATDFSQISNQPTTISNIKARALTFTATQGIFKLQFRQICLIFNNNAYVITFSAEKERFSQYESIANSIINSFIILNTASTPSI